jgi:hypothetical protein
VYLADTQGFLRGCGPNGTRIEMIVGEAPGPQEWEGKRPFLSMAAMVAAAKALLEFDKSDPRARDAVSTEDARGRLIGNIADASDSSTRSTREDCAAGARPQHARPAKPL